MLGYVVARDKGVAGDYVERAFGPGHGWDPKLAEAQKAAERRSRKMACKKLNEMQAKRPLLPPNRRK